MNTQVTEYINNASVEQKEIMERIRTLIHQTVKNTIEDFKWSRPVFSRGKDFAYFKTAKSYVSFGLMQAQKIHDKNNLLEGTGKDMRHIKIKTSKDIDEELLKEWLIAMTEDI